MVALAAAEAILGTMPTQSFVRVRIHWAVSSPESFICCDVRPAAEVSAVDVAIIDDFILPDTFPAFDDNTVKIDVIDCFDKVEPEGELGSISESAEEENEL
jgi:hypothetical protein